MEIIKNDFKNYSDNYRKMKLCKESMDAIILANVGLDNSKNLKTYPYRTAKGEIVTYYPQKLMLGTPALEYKYLLGQTYAYHHPQDDSGKPNFHPVDDFLYLANEDGSKGKPWTTDKQTFNLFMDLGVTSQRILTLKGSDGKMHLMPNPIVPPVFHKERED